MPTHNTTPQQRGNPTAGPKMDAPKRSRDLPASAFKTLARPIRRFAEAMLETGDVTTAYLESHPDCKSMQSAKYRGRALLKRGDVRALVANLKQELKGNQGDATRKGALLSELETLAFAHVNLKKIHPKEKLTALRAIAELEGLLAPKPASAGIRATFNFHVGGRNRGAQARQAITVDMGTAERAIVERAPIDELDTQSDTTVAEDERPDVLDPSGVKPDRG